MSEKNNGISIANILAMLGLAGLGVLSFFGLFFQSPGGNLTKPVLLAVAIVAGFALLLIIMVRTKGANDNPDKWRFVEWGALVIYLVAAFFAAKPTLHFFYVVSEKEHLQAMAKEEIAGIEQLYKTYGEWKDETLGNAIGQADNYMANPQYQADSEDNPLHHYVTGKMAGNPKKWGSVQDKIISLVADPRIADLQKRVSAWEFLKLPSLASDLVKAEDGAWKRVEDKLKTLKDDDLQLIPVITGGVGEPYALAGLAEFELPTQMAPAFTKALSSGNHSTALGWIIYVVLHLLILLDYLLSRRSSFVGPSKNVPSNGLDL